MNAIINYVLFIIFTAFAFNWLMSSRVEMKSPLDKNAIMVLTGPQAFWILTFATGLLAFAAPGIVDLMAFRMLMIEIMCLIAISKSGGFPKLPWPLVIYCIYMLYIVCGLFYTNEHMYGIRTCLKYVYPLLISMLAIVACNDIETFIKSGKAARIIAAICFLAITLPGVKSVFGPVFGYVTAVAINYISIIVFSLGMYYYTDVKKKNLIWTLLFMIPAFLWTFRTSIMGSGIAIMAFYLIKYRVKALPIIAGILVAGVIAVFTIPSLYEKMFFEDTEVTLEQVKNGEFDEKTINTNFREYMWEKIQGILYEGHEMTGSGTGSTQAYIYQHPDEFGGLNVVHSDFVQQKCDNGLIGLIMYGAAVIGIFIHCFVIYYRHNDVRIKMSSIIAGASALGVYATLYSDNVVNYSVATLSMPFGFYGMMIGLKRAIEVETAQPSYIIEETVEEVNS